MVKCGDIEDISISKRIYGVDHLLFHNNETIFNAKDNEEEKIKIEYVKDIVDYINSEDTCKDMISFQKFRNKLNSKYKIGKVYRKSTINLTLRKLYVNDIITLDDMKRVLKYTIGKKSRSLSGILEVAVMTKPGKFSCEYDCYYCPNQEGMPRSYVKEGPAARRAAQWNFDTIKQIKNRLTSYSINGHEIDKLEIIVIGGTWSSYSMEYREEFINEVYYAVNTFFDINPREMLSLNDEKHINETAICKISGITIETRPDCITKEEIDSFNYFGVTRVQIGIQHPDDYILKKINRKCTVKEIKEGIKLLRDSGFKVLIHLMPNLPFSNPELDKKMFDTIIEVHHPAIGHWILKQDRITHGLVVYLHPIFPHKCSFLFRDTSHPERML